MALELHALLPLETVPTREEWQAAIDEVGLPLTLDAELNLPSTNGFRPCVLAGDESGIEMYVDSPDEILTTHPRLRAHSAPSLTVISFRWGGDLRECACALGAAAGLVSKWQAVAYYPEDDLIYDLDSLQHDFAECLGG